VDSKDGDFVLPRVQAYGTCATCPVVMCRVALKATNNHLLPSLLPPVLAEGGWCC